MRIDKNKVAVATRLGPPDNKADRPSPCISLFDGIQPHIKSRYKQLALATREEHITALDENDEDTLIVSCNWLIWQKLAATGRHCVYFELGLFGWVPDDTLIHELYLRCNDWIPTEGDGDPSLFQDISLGRLFGAEVSMFLRNYYRLDRSLRKLCERFQPEKIWFFDYIYDVSVISAPLRRRIVEEVGREMGIPVIDKSGDGSGEHEIGESVYIQPSKSAINRKLVSLYAFLLEMTTRARTLFAAPGRRVLFLVNSNMAEPLVQNFEGGLTPVFIGRTIPRKAGMIWRCIRKNMLLLQYVVPELSVADMNRVDKIERNLSKAIEAPAERDIAFMREYVREEILNPGRFRKMAREVLAAERLLNQAKPQRVVVDGVRNFPPRIVIEFARKQGIPVDYTWHSPHSPQRLKYDTLGGDPNFTPCVTRCLSWGKINDMWLDRVHAPADRVRTGSPLMSKYTSADWAPKNTNLKPEERNVLLLQYTFNLADFAGLNANLYEGFVRTVRDLNGLGYRKIHYKLHPGRGRWKKSYFEQIARHFELNCPILKTEPYKECLAWSDVVIGSALTGAMFETLAAGRPYVALLLSPHSMDTSYYEGFPMCASLDDIPAAMNQNIEAESLQLLTNMYSSDEFPNPAKRIWDVLESDFTQKGNS